MQTRKGVDLAECHRQHFRRQAGTAHAEQENVAEAFFLDIFCYALQVAAMSDFVFSNPEPAQPIRFVGAGPERCIALPQTADFSCSAPIV